MLVKFSEFQTPSRPEKPGMQLGMGLGADDQQPPSYQPPTMIAEDNITCPRLSATEGHKWVGKPTSAPLSQGLCQTASLLSSLGQSPSRKPVCLGCTLSSMQTSIDQLSSGYRWIGEDWNQLESFVLEVFG